MQGRDGRESDGKDQGLSRQAKEVARADRRGSAKPSPRAHGPAARRSPSARGGAPPCVDLDVHGVAVADRGAAGRGLICT